MLWWALDDYMGGEGKRRIIVKASSRRFGQVPGGSVRGWAAWEYFSGGLDLAQLWHAPLQLFAIMGATPAVLNMSGSIMAIPLFVLKYIVGLRLCYVRHSAKLLLLGYQTISSSCIEEVGIFFLFCLRRTSSCSMLIYGLHESIVPFG